MKKKNYYQKLVNTGKTPSNFNYFYQIYIIYALVKLNWLKLQDSVKFDYFKRAEKSGKSSDANSTRSQGRQSRNETELSPIPPTLVVYIFRLSVDFLGAELVCRSHRSVALLSEFILLTHLLRIFFFFLSLMLEENTFFISFSSFCLVIFSFRPCLAL